MAETANCNHIQYTKLAEPMPPSFTRGPLVEEVLRRGPRQRICATNCRLQQHQTNQIAAHSSNIVTCPKSSRRGADGGLCPVLSVVCRNYESVDDAEGVSGRIPWLDPGSGELLVEDLSRNIWDCARVHIPELLFLPLSQPLPTANIAIQCGPTCEWHVGPGPQAIRRLEPLWQNLSLDLGFLEVAPTPHHRKT